MTARSKDVLPRMDSLFERLARAGTWGARPRCCAREGAAACSCRSRRADRAGDEAPGRVRRARPGCPTLRRGLEESRRIFAQHRRRRQGPSRAICGRMRAIGARSLWGRWRSGRCASPRSSSWPPRRRSSRSGGSSTRARPRHPRPHPRPSPTRPPRSRPRRRPRAAPDAAPKPVAAPRGGPGRSRESSTSRSSTQQRRRAAGRAAPAIGAARAPRRRARLRPIRSPGHARRRRPARRARSPRPRPRRSLRAPLGGPAASCCSRRSTAARASRVARARLAGYGEGTTSWCASGSSMAARGVFGDDERGKLLAIAGSGERACPHGHAARRPDALRLVKTALRRRPESPGHRRHLRQPADRRAGG